MFGRSLLFLAWALLGGVFAYASLYALTPYGWIILGAVGLLAWGLFRLTGRRSLEIWGLLAGPGLLCILVAANADESAAGWASAGAVFVGTTTIVYALVGRDRCGHST